MSIEKREPVCIRIPEENREKIQEMARTMSYHEKRDVHWHDLIRLAIEEFINKMEQKNEK